MVGARAGGVGCAQSDGTGIGNVPEEQYSGLLGSGRGRELFLQVF